MKRPPQPIAKKHYLSNKYEDFNLWIDYWYQKKFLIETKPNKILEIGKGTGTLEMILERDGYNFTTLDIDKDLSPDVVGDVTKLPFKDNSYDTSCAFEVLEHIPFEEFSIALKELRRVSKKYVVISLPYATIFFSFAFQLFYMKSFSKIFRFLGLKPFEPSYINFSIPLFFLDKKGMIKAHAWEIGRKNLSIFKIRKVIREQGFLIVKESGRIFYPYHRFFVLKKL
ncbi:MAG TPA: methyltransferase domain-containing protein [Patescibacteria group bacterium]|nr:methyltransferase domain-containing protein [Patescibacteria group bacterium]